MRKTEGYILNGVNFYADKDGNQYCEMKLTGKGETIYEKYKLDHEQSLKIKLITDDVYKNNEQVK